MYRIIGGPVLTLAGVGGPAVVEPSQTGLAAGTIGVVHTLQTLSAASMAAPHHADVDVSVTLAGSAGLRRHAVTPSSAAIKPLLTDVTVIT